MSNSMAAIEKDMDEYRRLCAKYGEKLQYCDDGFPDCYGIHATKLIKKELREE
jgi:hypothetical protein